MSLRCPLATIMVELDVIEDSFNDVNLVHLVDKTFPDDRMSLFLLTPLSPNHANSFNNAEVDGPPGWVLTVLTFAYSVCTSNDRAVVTS